VRIRPEGLLYDGERDLLATAEYLAPLVMGAHAPCGVIKRPRKGRIRIGLSYNAFVNHRSVSSASVLQELLS